MSMRSKIAVLLAVCAAGALAQQTPSESRSNLRIDFPKDSPLAVVSADMGDTLTTARGSAMVVDLRAALTLRNSGSRRVRGVTLLVAAQETAAGGKASVSVPSLNIAPGETFPVRINLRLLRPLYPAGPLVVVTLDGVLFEDLSFFGPDTLKSRRSLTVWELEAQRDRRHFKSVLAAKGKEGLQREILDSLARQAERPRLDVQYARGGRSTTVDTEKRVQFTFLNIPGAPLEPLEGMARVAGNEARAPSIEVRNGSDRRIRYFEIGWIVRDAEGREYLAGSVPASDPDLSLAPGQTSRVLQDASLRFAAAPGRPLTIAGMTGFVSQAQFADGSIWIPTRATLAEPRLSRTLAPSAEEERLTDLYRRKGLAAILEELEKF